ncbi:type III-B CRISPR module RAMP protein Cmr1 [Gelria sp. Kuro-4]|uniref:type III-B CRISPR module RAMP protein Cmr1 n=1 Tax=Gelria sp. Kuro-4 TaxID=2796927 RepID=UPI001BEE3F1B|nr:type III-B CRISPR module RAMP protein Cmr1 [Gelria sp. Kuro-4]BCV26030.1 CRISPR-associated protein Cmr1 [Gelria sp. Kuro-4]
MEMGGSITRVTFVPRTPLWTGDIRRQSNEIKETGLLGSLRWWTEAVLRALGRYVCDPTHGNEAGVDPCPYKDHPDHYCIGCAIFGATGRRRSFRLQVGQAAEWTGTAVVSLPIKPRDRTHGWTLQPGVSRDTTLEIIGLSPHFEPAVVLFPLTIAARWAAIGAKTRLGYGVVELLDPADQGAGLEQFQEGLAKLTQHTLLRADRPDQQALPNLRDMFFAKVRFKITDDWLSGLGGMRKKVLDWCHAHSYSAVPVTPLVKNWLRFEPEGKKLWSPPGAVSTGEVDKWLFGFAGSQKRQAGRINVSWAYPLGKAMWELRLWGWLPRGNTVPSGFNRQLFLNKLQTHLKSPQESVLGFIPGGSITGVDWQECTEGLVGTHFLRQLMNVTQGTSTAVKEG